MSAPPFTQPPAEPAPEHQASLEHLLLRFGLVTLDQLSAALREQTETGTPFTESLVRDGIVSAEDLARVADRTPSQPAPAPAPEPEPAPEPPPLAAEIVLEPEPVSAPEPPVVEVAAPPLSAPEAVDEAPVFVPESFIAAMPDREPVAAPAPAPAPVSLPEPTYVADPPAPVVTGFVVRGRLVNGEEIEIASVDDPAQAQRIALDAMRACARPDGSDWPILNGRYVRPESIVSIEVAERF